MIGSADLHQAIYTLWVDSGLDAKFKANWPAAKVGEFASLLDETASAAHPHPYCVFTSESGTVATRMSAAGGQTVGKMENRDIPLEFHVHGKALKAGLSAKQFVASLAEEVMKVFGGHPTVAPQVPALDTGGLVRVQFQSDTGVRDDENVWRWIIRYTFLADVPVA